MRLPCARLGLIALAALAGCEASTPATAPSPVTREGLVTVTAATMTVTTSLPASVTVQVLGTVPDGCTEVAGVTQQRGGSLVTITVRSRRTTDGPCTTALKNVEASVRLDGTFAAGTYTVRVNGTDWTLRV
jgi:hypothetical protein